MERLTKKQFPKNQAAITCLQFGEGNFMRGFVDWQLQQLNNQGLYQGNVAIVQPLAHGLSEKLAEQDQLYTVLLQGLVDGQVIDTTEPITVIERTINPYEQWQEFLALAEIDELAFVFSNTTEAGITYHDADAHTDTPPTSFPAKLTAFLYHRFKMNKKGLTIIPCELIDRNAELLKKFVLQYAQSWELETGFVDWLHQENHFYCSLVDRIVPGFPKDDIDELHQRLGYDDQLLVKAEPFMLWVIEAPEELNERLPLKKAGLNVVLTDDLTPYRERKVHLLNGPHTAMVPLGLLAGVTTVEEVMKDPLLSSSIDTLVTHELIPMLQLPEEELLAYARQINERFLNPFANHQLQSIALNSVAKFQTRLLPILKKYIEKKEDLPPYLTVSLAALMLLYRSDHTNIQVNDEPEVLSRFTEAWADPQTAVLHLLKNPSLWGEDLSVLPNLTEAVSSYVTQIDQKGIRNVLQELKG
ncbi:tagaturonate reductase [Enterococcus sp. DIV1298c]|uniref:tagaturonate reductase n=1 Tax=Enterococcus sp. DIV1298c TaxID=2815328 RepID=UPI001A918F43|nr:tagaturonate reductase [Enterococcus sp. DIV1298c]MBO0460882.1 tagaturonate reductase [Enterococcus sp. DIV1298c]